MKRFLILHAFNLKSDGDKLKLPGQYLAADDEAQVAELRTFEQDGACKEIHSEPKTEPKKKEEPKEAAVDQSDDISLVKGIGQKTAEKLADKGIKTKSALKAALGDEEVKEILGANFEKVSEQLN